MNARGRRGFARTLGCAALAAALACCAPTEIKRVETAGDAAALPAPQRIVVEDFALAPEQVKVDASALPHLEGMIAGDPDTPEAIGRARTAARSLAKHLVADLRRLGWPAWRAADVASSPGDLRIGGEFVAVDEGDGTERLLIGLGLGRSKLATHVQVWAITAAGTVTVEEFDVRSKGGHARGVLDTLPLKPISPGAMGAGSSAAVGAGEEALGPEVEADVRRVARGISAQLSSLFLQRRWMPPAARRPAG
jgi:Domain of unknown function (DUF4410)